MTDTHCHLNFHSFETDYDQVIQNASAAGVHTIINAGTQVSSSKWAVELAQKYQNLYAVVGVHPHHADKIETDWLKDLENLAKHPKVVGIGECGVDYFSYKSNGVVEPEDQKNVFLQHLELTHKLKLPLQIHSRTEHARKDVLEILTSIKNNLQDPPGMFHCMAGSKESLRRALNLGFYLGFDGNITYNGAPPGEPEPLRDLVAYSPLDRIVIETDSPYLTPVPHKGERNEPKYAIITAEYIADIKKISVEKVIEQTDKNVYTVFKKLKNPRF
jgi:TatD DNase family protein